MSFRVASAVTMNEAVALLEKSKIKSSFDCGGMRVTILDTEQGDTVLVQGSGEEFLMVA